MGVGHESEWHDQEVLELLQSMEVAVYQLDHKDAHVPLENRAVVNATIN